ncbi:GNAT family N-acetyltransferase [Pandoraea cepalis]|nr:GNAT family N-acetyltransferase [Pandoraea cepalis]
MTQRTYRAACPEDAAICIEIRGRTRENAFSAEALLALGISVQTWCDIIESGAVLGNVCCVDDQVIGYCFADAQTGEILVLAVLPEHEGLGVGRALLQRVVDALLERGFHRLFLACSADPASRSYGFYRKLGWTPTGERDDAGDDILEHFLR